MADRPSARDDDRLPWLEPFEGEKRQTRKRVSPTALVALLVAFFGVGLAVAFSLGYRVARPADSPSVAIVEPAQRTASVTTPLPPPTPEPQAEPAPPPAALTEAPVVAVPAVAAPKPVVKKARPKAKKRYAKRKPILRPFELVKRPPLVAVPPAPAVQGPQPAPVSPPVQRPVAVRRPIINATPKGRVIQLGAYSTQKQADAAYRTLIWRYPYLKTKPKVVSPTPLVGGWRYYRLRLGTATQAQSAVICQRLQRRGQSCIVIY